MGRPTWELGSYNLIQLATFMIRCYPNSSYVVNIVCSVSGTGKDVGLYAEYARMGVQHEDQSDVGFQIWDNSMYLSSGTEIIGHRPPQEWMVSLKCWANVLVLNVGGVIAIGWNKTSCTWQFYAAIECWTPHPCFLRIVHTQEGSFPVIGRFESPCSPMNYRHSLKFLVGLVVNQPIFCGTWYHMILVLYVSYYVISITMWSVPFSII